MADVASYDETMTVVMVSLSERGAGLGLGQCYHKPVTVREDPALEPKEGTRGSHTWVSGCAPGSAQPSQLPGYFQYSDISARAEVYSEKIPPQKTPQNRGLRVSPGVTSRALTPG